MCDQTTTNLLQSRLDIVIKIQKIEISNLEGHREELRLHHERTLSVNKSRVRSAKLDLEQASLDAAAASRLKEIARLNLELANVEQELKEHLDGLAAEKFSSSSSPLSDLLEKLFTSEDGFDPRTTRSDDFDKVLADFGAQPFDFANLFGRSGRSSSHLFGRSYED